MVTTHQNAVTSDRAIAALDRVLRWLEAGPGGEDASSVLSGSVTATTIRLGLRTPRVLPEPFMAVPVGADPSEPQSVFDVNVEDVFQLEDCRSHLPRHAAGLVPVGSTRDGSAQILQNFIDLKLMGINGNRLFTQGAVAGLAIEAATTPWNSPVHLHLVGFGRLGQALVAASGSWHAPELIHLYDTVDELDGEEIRGQIALVFLQDVNADAAFSTYLNVTGSSVGVIAGAHVRNALTLFHETNFQGTFEPFNLEVSPVMVHEQSEEYQALVALAPARTPAPSASAAAPVIAPNAATVEPEPEPVDADGSQLEQDPERETAGGSEQDTGAGAMPELSGALAEPEPVAPAGPDSEQNPEPVDVDLVLFGEVACGELTGQPAEAVAAVVLGGGQLPVERVSTALWPDDAAEGETARKRRTRTLKRIKDAGVPVEQAGGAWMVTGLRTSVDAALATVDVETLARVITGPPLGGCGVWADQYRASLSERVLSHLDAVSDAALGAKKYDDVTAVAGLKQKLRG